ncbi:MAG: electron transport complex subunit RsxC [Candidatus Endonucleobacter sp. (ex Gigantidas childressi)]|nr:electron transport complex subunit RsxC [Candidatus Endonucleobacter sp. (ex Gigantidas childressi)]
MAIKSFPGGVHPSANKGLSTSLPIATLPIFKEYVLPLNQHSGTQAQLLVNVGEQVLKGQVLANASSFVSAPIHAPTSGLISAIRHQQGPNPSGLTEDCIILTSDGKDQWTSLQPIADYKNTDPQDLIERIYNAGVVGLGGAGFPSAVKMAPQTQVNITTLVVNGAECEPYITADDMLMRERAQKIISGIDILHYILKLKQVFIGIEDNKPKAIKAIDKACSDRPYQRVTIPTKYPSGDAQILIYLLTGQEVPSEIRSMEMGILCYNVGTLVAIHDAIIEGKPLISRITTLSGKALVNPQNVEALIGTPIRELLNFAGIKEIKQKDLYQLIVGGSMMGFSLESTEVPIIKTTNCLIAATKEELPLPPPPQACIRCGLCSEVCPCSLLPQQLFWYAKEKNHNQLIHHNLFDCIECGACSFVCPSTIPLVQYYRASKDNIRQQEAKHIKSEQSKQRFEFRQKRIDRERAEKEARRKSRMERQAKLKQEQIDNPDSHLSTSELDPIKEAIAKAKAKKRITSGASLVQQSLSQPSLQHQKLKIQIAAAKAQLKKNEHSLLQTSAKKQDTVEKLNSDIDMLKKQINELQNEYDAPSLQIPPSVNLSATVDSEKQDLEQVQAQLLNAKKKKEQLESLLSDTLIPLKTEFNSGNNHDSD